MSLNSDKRQDSSESMLCAMSTDRLAIPVQFIDQVVDCTVSHPPPLAESWVCGLLTYNGQIHTLIRWSKGEISPEKQKVVVLTVPGRDFNIGIPVEIIEGIQRVWIAEEPAEHNASLPTQWFRVTKQKNIGSSMFWLNVPALFDQASLVSQQEN